jgi:hypothetical protein
MTRTFHLRSLASVVVLTLLSVTATAQEPAKTVEWANHASPNDGRVPEPFGRRIDEIELEDILIDGRSILIGEPFIGDFRNLSFRVKNVSDKPISFVQITVILPEVPKGPQVPFVLPRLADSKTAKPLLPGEETNLKLPEGAIYNWVKDTVSSQGKDLQTLTKASIDIILLGTQNRGGCIKTRDPRNGCPLK